MEKRKIYGLIIGIIGFIILLVGATYALYKWANTEEQRTHVNLTITDDIKESVIYNPGTSILETDGQILEVGEDYTSGISTTIEFWKTSQTTRVINGSLYLKILNMLSKDDTADANIRRTNTVKWAITTYSVRNSDEVLLSTGSFYGKNIGNTFALKENVPLNPYKTFFKVYLWLDSKAVDAKRSVSGELLSTEISAKAVGTEQFEVLGENAAEKIMALSSTDNCASNTSGVCPTNGYATDANGDTIYHEYRYRGANVDNYVWFNNDMYRIIGVFDNNSHGIEDSEGNGVYMLKLIAANLLTSTSYGAYNSPDSSNPDTYLKKYVGFSNQFVTTEKKQSNANILLNEYFNYNPDTIYGACGNWTYYNSDAKTNDCSDILGYSIKDSDLKNYIETVKWYLYGYTDDGEDKEFFYTCERGGNSCRVPSGLTENVYLEDEIGLMYVSDYLYASGNVASGDTDTLASSSNNSNQNWLYKGFEWTITPQTNSNADAFRVRHSGNVKAQTTVDVANGIRPTFYLKSSILITGGDGTFDNPYTIST